MCNNGVMYNNDSVVYMIIMMFFQVLVFHVIACTIMKEVCKLMCIHH